MFFLASMGISQAHEQAVMNYWWVRPEETPAHAARVIRVLGEKGERFEDVYTLDRQARLENSPVIMQARLQRQEMLRREAMALVKKLKAEGKSPLVAYEEAWTRVYKNRWLTANWQLGSSKLEDMLLRMSGENQSELTAEEQQWVLEALLENDDRLETEAGRELLRRLTQRLRALGYGKLYAPYAANDQVMKRFADALSTGMDSMAAYRESMFTTHRDRVGQHSLHGYVAPWGLHVGGPRYHQAPQKVGVTEGSASGLDAVLAANPQPGNQLTAPGLNDVSAVEKDFLASSPENEKKEKDEEDEKKNEQEDELVKQGESTTSAPTAGMAAAPAPMMRSFSLRAAAAPVVAAAAAGSITVTGNASYHVNAKLEQGNRNNAEWSDNFTKSSGSGWFSSSINYSAWGSGDTISGTISQIDLADGNLYLGNGYTGCVKVIENGVIHAESTETKSSSNWFSSTSAVVPVAGSGVFRYGTLAGSGTLTLSNNATSGSPVVYIFNDAATHADSWFAGEVKFGASREGIVQLDLGASGATTAWDGVVFQMSGSGVPTAGYGVKTTTAPKRTILNIRSAVTIAGLDGGTASSTVTSQSTDTSYMLTLGDIAGKDYVYGGTFKGTFYNDAGTEFKSPAGLNITKVGENTQTFSREITEAQALHNVKVESGKLVFADAHINKANVTGGELKAEGLHVIGAKTVSYNSDEQPLEPEEVQVSGTGVLTVTGHLEVKDDLLVLDKGRVNAGSLTVDSNMRILSTADTPAVSVSGHTKVSGEVRVDSGQFETGSLSVGGTLFIGHDTLETFAKVSTLTSSLNATGLRIRGDGSLVTTGSVNISQEQYLHAGASWYMAGDNNKLSGVMNVRHFHDTPDNQISFSGSGTKEKDVVLTMPGVIDFSSTETGQLSCWTNPDVAVFTLNGVTLDFGSAGETVLRNVGFDVKQGMHITLADTGNGGWFSAEYPSIVIQGQYQNYHGILSYENNHIIITVEHAIETPFVIKKGGAGYENKQSEASGVVYIEMSPNVGGKSLPFTAYDGAVYTTQSDPAFAGKGWSDKTPVSADKLLAFTNIAMEDGAKLYMGESATTGANGEDYRADRRFDGNIDLQGGSPSVEIHGQVGDWGNWQLGGHLGGDGNLKLVAHSGNSNAASVYTFTNLEKPQNWLNGTVSLADPSKGIVQLNVGNVNVADQGDTRWENVVVDLNRNTFTDSVIVTSVSSGNKTYQSGQASRLVLALCGDTTLKGLDGGDDNTQVVSNLRATSNKTAPTLTIGGNKDCTFSGKVGIGSYYEGGEWSSQSVEGGRDIETNHYSTREGSLNLTKVGSNTQTFAGEFHAEDVVVKEGTLVFSGKTNLETLTVHTGAKVITGNEQRLTLGSVSLYGGSTWDLTTSSDFSGDPFSLLDVQSGPVNITSSAQIKWTSMKQLDLGNAGTLNGDSALFKIGSNVTLTLSNTLNITNLAGVSEGYSFALYDLGSKSFTLGNQSVLVMDDEGNYYSAHYAASGGIISVVIDSQRNYGIVVDPTLEQNTATSVKSYYWSGVSNNNTTLDDVNHMGITLGHVWRADGSSDNTGWHEQRTDSVSPGVYVNGTGVIFSDNTVHHYSDKTSDNTNPHRVVHVQGKVAPGKMLVDATQDSAKIGAGEAEMKYGYAFLSADGSDKSRISDYTDDKGNIIERTSITKTGESVLILHMPNDFTGGIDVQNGALYFSRPDAGGSGPITLHNDAQWTDYWDKTGSSTNGNFATVERTGVEFMVNYQHSSDVASAYRNPWVKNTILLEGNKDGYVTISYARAAYDETTNDFANVPRHWRNLNLTGGVFGEGNLHLRGYTSTYYSEHDQSYVASFSINKSQLDKQLLASLNKPLTDFTGTVTLENTVNYSRIDSDKLSGRTAGSVQLVLQDDVFGKGRIDLTRTIVNDAEANRQSFAHILVVNGDVSVGALSGAFTEKGYFANGYSDKTFRDINQANERWRVRTVTASQTTLRLGRALDTENDVYVYSGTMGFAQSYTQPQQAHILVDNGLTLYRDAPSNFKNSGSFSNGVEQLSLVKTGAARQYIHTAVLDDVSVFGGTLGFNYLNLKGNLDMVDGTTLKLGVTGGDTNWSTISGTSYNTTNKVTLNSGKTLTLHASGADWKQATIEGNVSMAKDSALTFQVNGSTPYWLSTDVKTKGNESSIIPLLSVTGTLALQSNQVINLTFDNVDFQTGRKYYLASADKITIGGVDDETDFGTRMVTLGYGYFGTLYTVGNQGSSSPVAGDVDKAGNATTDYLVMTVSGDPRHTWSGMPDSYVWKGTPHTDKAAATTERFDYRWKENTEFINGDVVLFGNLYKPTKWTDTSRLTSDESVKVLTELNGTPVQPCAGTLVQDTDDAKNRGDSDRKFNIDGYSVEEIEGSKGFQAVKLDGRVAPFIVMINSNYESQSQTEKTVTTTNKQTVDATNYYFYCDTTEQNGQVTFGGGYIDDATPEELKTAEFDTGWKTMLHKTGTGTTVMALDNRYTGGTILQGKGLMVMQHVNALGYVWNPETHGRAGEGEGDKFKPYDATITLMDGAGLQGDFNDDWFEGNYTGGHVSVGGAMYTTTINNKVVVNEYVDPNNADYASAVDGRLINSHSKKLILRELVGEKDTVVELNGVGLTAERSLELYGIDNKYRYGVFKVIDPSHFYGTVRMNGQVWGSGPADAGGKVQLDIMSTAKSDDGADWCNAVIDLSVNATTERTVLGLDVTSSGEICLIDSVTGTIREGGSSSVLNLSNHFAATLELEGMRNGDYDGVFGYGDFQVAVNYGGYTDAMQGTTQHHYGSEGHGTLDVRKKGDATTQSVRRAWLDDVIVEGGAFHVKEALVARNIEAGGTTRVHVGNLSNTFTLYTLAIGQGGILAMNTGMEETGAKTDAWAGVRAGSDLGDVRPEGDSSGDGEGSGTAFVRLENGATLSAREDWFTGKQVDIYDGAMVTINTHNLTIDPYILNGENVQKEFLDKRDRSHIIQLLGPVTGSNVTLNVNNWMIDPETNQKQVVSDASGNLIDDFTYVTHMGYAALNDLNDFGGSSKVNVEAMTVLQILQGNGGATSDVDITVEGKNATLQILDKQVVYTSKDDGKTYSVDTSKSTDMVQYIDKLVLGHNASDAGENPNATDPLHRENNGQLLLGGSEVKELKPGNEYLTSPKLDGIQVMVSTRHNSTDESIKGTLEHVHVDMSGNAVKLGGTDALDSLICNSHVDMIGSGIDHRIHHAQLRNSLVHLQEDCTVNIEDMVLVAQDSVIRGAKVSYDSETHLVQGTTVDPSVGPGAAVGKNPLQETVEVSTSVNTTVQLTFAGSDVYTVGNSTVLVLLVDQFQGVDVSGDGLTLQLTQDLDSFLQMGFDVNADFIALQIGGGSGRFEYEASQGADFSKYIDSKYVLQEADGSQVTGYWVTSQAVATASGVANVSMHMLYFTVPEPTTATLSLAALVALMGRRRRKN